ncbi:MAG: sensor histidine kinase [Gammaproteobacteria bacterium]|nr:sensor histidine kinase [Gammaproteobacteria bacterium]
MSRPVLSRLSDLPAGIIGYFMVLIVTFFVSVGAIWIEGWILGRISIHLLEEPRLIGNLLIASILAAFVLRFFYLQAQYRKRIVIAADAKLQALQARIQPHFLFNSMNIIAGLIPTNPKLAEKVIEDLSDLFRASLAEYRSQVSLSSEIDLCKHYLDIEQLRLGDRLKSQWQIPESINSVSIPPLTLQPLIENAIYHGIQPLVEGGLICIDITIANGYCNITIENPLSEISISKNSGNNIAVGNIRERLQMLYQDEASLDMQIKESQCIVTLVLPCEVIQ